MKHRVLSIVNANIDKITNAVVNAYIHDKKALTVKEIAALPGMPSESTVRKYVSHCSMLDFTRKDIRIDSRDFPGMCHGYRSVEAWVPSRRALVEVIERLSEFVPGLGPIDRNFNSNLAFPNDVKISRKHMEKKS